MKIYIKTYGCTLNQADSKIIESILKTNNIIIKDIEKSDIVIINSCTVKKVTEQKILAFIESQEKQKKKMIITGCIAGANSDLIEKYYPNLSIVSPSNINKMQYVIDNVLIGKKIKLDEINKIDKLIYFKPDESIIAKIPISEGCLNTCSFCETKYARGVLNSFSEELIIKVIKQSLEMGAKEIRLTAQDTGCYGLDKKTNIIELLNKILELDYDFKLRLGMMNPEYLNKFLKPLIKIMQNNKMYKFIHLPVQSGSNKILKDMKRKYKIEEFYKHIEFIRKNIKQITIETDVIIGFPTETDQDFIETINMVKRIKPEAINISKFGTRPHNKILGNLNPDVVKQRSIQLSRIAREIRYNYNTKFINKKISILVTEETNRSINGRNNIYKEIIIENPEKKILGTYQQIRINFVSANALYGSIIN